MYRIFSIKLKITLSHSLPRSVQAKLTAHGKVVTGCTVTKDPILQYFTYTKGC